MTCGAIIQTATASVVSATSLRPERRQPNRSAPAAITVTGPSNAGVNATIASRCKKLVHANNVQRLRYLSVHRALATYSAGVGE